MDPAYDERAEVESLREPLITAFPKDAENVAREPVPDDVTCHKPAGVVQGLCGALDTQVAQAYGAGNLSALGPIFKRTLLFLWLHCLPITGLLLAAPHLLRYLSREEQLARMAHSYILALVPAVWLDALARPLNRVLVAQRITRPQMVISLAIVPMHVATTYALIHPARLGYVGAALAVGVSNALIAALTSAYIYWAGLAPRVFGGEWARVLQGWHTMAALAYPAMVMRCAESSAFSAMTVLAARLPDPDTSVAAISVAFSTCAVFYMPFNAFGMTACTQVGNMLGAGDGRAARTAALASALIGPLLWTAPAVLLLEPHCQAAVISVFTSSTDAALLGLLRPLMRLVAAVSLFDGVQTVLTGVVEGAGKQLYGAYTNLAVFYCFAVPLALWMAFGRGLGVVGMWSGMLAGSVLQPVPPA
ncbi:Multidrug and toxin extrusion protein 1 [Tetrabaena socialis]|uniref:Multidrug and toxin extrusion protein 1 n=1 Tax=Tetrabaena socialis TaxID=47790 RepID=A0A2J8AJF4_9CHLO|nr:Multidrug and toxin extrusion protein 1 [Tetrabaena socialis]|eukprot:PNH12640.1 Multidrug and toxin extrusion protein 1 [Tetrabaena socialis]